MAERENLIGKNIHKYRNACTLTQEQLGAAIGVTYQQIQKYENGANQPSAMQILKIAEATGIPVEYFFLPFPESGSEEKPRYGTRKGAAGRSGGERERVELLQISQEEKRIILLYRGLKGRFSRESVLIHLRNIQKVEAETGSPGNS